MTKSLIALGLLVFLSQNVLAVDNSNCSEIIKKTVTASEFIISGQSFSKLKSAVINQALKDAVQQVTGMEIRDFSSLNLSSNNESESERFRDSSTSKTRGKVASYNIVDQQIINMGDGKVLEITVDANICIQDKSDMRSVLLIGDFTYKNQSWPQFRGAIKSVFSQQSDSFELGSGHPDSTYYDISITGRIDQISQDKKIDKKAVEDAQGMAVFQGFLGAMNQGDKNKNNPFSNIFNSIPDNSAALNKVHVKVYASVSASHKTDNRDYTASAMVEKEVSEDSVNSVVDALAFEAVKKASKDLYIKLNVSDNKVDIMNLLDY